MLKKVFFSIFVLCIGILYSSDEMPTVFIGTYNESNSDTINNLVIPNTPSGIKDGNWNLTHLTEDLLRGELKEKIKGDNFNLVLMKEFSNNLKDIVEDKDISDKKIGFLNVDTYQNIDKMSSGDDLVIITMSLIFAQIGEEANRANENNNFEVRYTNGITVNGVLEVSSNAPDRDKKIHDAYKHIYTKALGNLIDLISQDTKSKQVSSFTSDDMFFSIGKVKLGKKSIELAKKVYKDEELAKKQILMILQETLIKEIRKDKNLDDIVLLYPDSLNDIIVNNWASYLERMNEVSLDGASNNTAEVLVRSIKPSCRKVATSPREVPLDGYIIEVFLSELFDKVAEEADVNSAHYIKSTIVSRMIIPLAHKNKVDALSLPLEVVKKKKMVSGQASDYYNKNKAWSDVRKDKVTKTIRKSIEKISPKIVKLISDVVKLRKDNLGFDYKDFCKE